VRRCIVLTHANNEHLERRSKMKKAIVIAALALSACSANGPAYTGQYKSGVIVYRVPAISGSLTNWNVGVNDKHCNVAYNSYYHAPALGNVEVTTELWGTPGTTRLKLNAAKNKLHYVKLDVNTVKVASGFGGGLIGVFTAEAVSDTGGPFTLTQVDEQQAKREMLGMSEACK
jgi:hypothetical protein